MPNPSPPSSAPSSPDDHQDPPQLPPLGAADEDKVLEIVKQSEKVEKLPLVLWRNPITVLHYSTCELVLSLMEGAQALMRYKISLAISVIVMGKNCYPRPSLRLNHLFFSVMLALVHTFPGEHQDRLFVVETYLVWCGWWVGLGILSSVGLGTGLHTFLLYLGTVRQSGVETVSDLCCVQGLI